MTTEVGIITDGLTLRTIGDGRQTRSPSPVRRRRRVVHRREIPVHARTAAKAAHRAMAAAVRRGGAATADLGR